jgi:hypothetical protein
VRKLLALVSSGPLLAISIVTLSLITAFVAFTSANAAPNSIEIISISETSDSSVEILFNSSIPKKSLSYYVINTAVDPSVGQPKNINKVIKTKATGLITAEIKNLNPKATYNFSISAKTNKGKMISSAPVEYSPLSNLMDAISNLPADWGNPKPIQIPTAAPTAAPVAAPAAPIVISVAAIAGATAPVTGATPVTTTTAGTGYTGTVSWSTSPTTFAAATAYTATITLAPTSGYTLTGVAANFFTVAGATPVTNSANAGVITAVFYMVGATGPGSGIVYYVNDAGFSCGATYTSTGSPTGGKCNYLEVAPSGWNTGNEPTKPWAAVSVNIDGIDNDITAYKNILGVGLGYKNSSLIVNQNGLYNATTNNYAAGAARAYAGGSKSDWYLPTYAELNLLCQWNHGVATINVTTSCTTGGGLNSITYGAGLSGFKLGNYWSSSEDDAVGAWRQSFINGFSITAGRTDNFYNVRPIRAF